MKQKHIIKHLLKYPNVVGVSNTLKPKIVKGKEIEEMAIRVYVKKKLPKKHLKEEEIIPAEIEGIKTDVIEIGEIYAAQYLPKALKAEKTNKWRPVIFGISIGHIHITSGTNGWLYKDKNRRIYFGSNAHVFTPNLSKEPDEIKVRTIVQPGPYDGGTEVDKVAEYFWHKKIEPEISISECPFAKMWCKIYNGFAKFFGRKTRLVPVVDDKTNNIDFAVAKPVIDWKPEILGFDYTDYVIVGHIFAGSDKVGIVCKIKYIVDEGYIPMFVPWKIDVEVGDILHKSGRTTCYSHAKVIDESATVRVNYLNFIALFEDVIITENPEQKFVQGGDSGSSAWIKLQ